MSKHKRRLEDQQAQFDSPQRQGGMPEQDTSSPEHDLNVLQRTAGNRAVTDLLSQASQSSGDHPHAVMARLGSGQPLDAALRARMQSTFGRDLSYVQVHTDDAAARLTSDQNARAVAVGQHIAFSPGEYRPGTVIGDGLIAHELAHVMQQDPSGPVTQAAAAHERDANRSAFGAVLGMARGAFSFAGNAAPRLKTGLSLQRCSRHQRYETPAFMGPHSREAVEEINGIIGSTEMLENMILGGTLVTIGTSSPAENLAGGSYDVEPQARALMAVPVIRRERIRTVISLLLISHENEMNQEERQFWYRALEALDRANSRGEETSR